MAVEYLGTGNDDGVVLGRSATDKIAFFNATPVVQQSGAALATIAITSATTGGFGFTTSAQAMALVDQVKAVGILTTV
jgi:hypothetical protein